MNDGTKPFGLALLVKPKTFCPQICVVPKFVSVITSVHLFRYFSTGEAPKNHRS